ncbi:hypothetical protein TRAPUB_4045 [Trametes pubescens]|uniref:CFEM domain-containing protein n=1 Tax=Trametes pubescens TaxID=154538 RepID=A0A1M2VC09_TRAPU|nr:hypothetical protein TRAPUB_4045 [Trametes pubescens]
MFARFLTVLLLPLLLHLAPRVDAAASLTPPAESSTASVGLSLSFTPTSSGSGTASTTGSASASTSGNGTATSSAQFPSLSGLSSCASQCLALAISQDGCDSVVSVNCYCVNPSNFTSGLVACITAAQCSGDLASAESIAQQLCAQASPSTSLSFPTAPPSTTFSDPFTSSTPASGSASRNSSSAAPSSATSPSTSTSASATSSTSAGQGNSAGVLRAVGCTGLLGIAAALAGAILA